MKIFLFLASLLSIIHIHAQTPLIFHKSHSGEVYALFNTTNSNFGVVRKRNSEGDYDYPKYEQVKTTEFNYFEVLNDSIIIKQTSDQNQLLISIDTLSNPEKLELQQFKNVHQLQDKVVRTEFVPLKHKENRSKKSDPEILQNNNKRNSPSFLLILFCVSAAGILILRLFRSREITSNN